MESVGGGFGWSPPGVRSGQALVLIVFGWKLSFTARGALLELFAQRLQFIQQSGLNTSEDFTGNYR
jgi:hypothetical protein